MFTRPAETLALIFIYVLLILFTSTLVILITYWVTKGGLSFFVHMLDLCTAFVADVIVFSAYYRYQRAIMRVDQENER